MQRTLLIVDDEKSILRALQRIFSRRRMNVIAVDNADDALEVLKHENCQVVLTDFRMPKKNGAQFLIEAKAQDPYLVGMILSGYADLQSVMAALNSGAVHKFIEKPWTESYLVSEVEQAFLVAEDLRVQGSLTRLAAETDEVLIEIDRFGTIFHLNPAACALLSGSPETLTGMGLEDFFPEMDSRGLGKVCLSDETNVTIKQGSEQDLLVNLRPISSSRWVISIAKNHVVGSLGLIELLGRAALMERLDGLLGRNRNSCTLVYFDISRFRYFNIYFGYRQSDQLLAEIARRLIDTKPADSVLGQINGDEFVLLIPTALPQRDVNELIHKMLVPFQDLIAFGGRELHINFNVGFAQSPEDGDNPEALICNARAAVNFAKSRGKRDYPRYQQSMNQEKKDLLVLQTDLYRALERNELSVVYQPKVELETGYIIGAEALLRWSHETLGMIPPGVFIPIAEESGLIEPIGEWVLSTASTQSKIWKAEGLSEFVISVNLSGRQLQEDDLVNAITKIIAKSGIEPHLLELEVTETFLMNDIDHSLTLLEGIKALGVKVAIDDFGTGYSSLNYLNQLPADTLKIDRSFIVDLPNSRELFDLVSGVIEMSHNLGMRVVAEGVELQSQLDILKELGCDEVQGFFYSQPVPAEDFRVLLENQPLNGSAYLPTSKGYY